MTGFPGSPEQTGDVDRNSATGTDDRVLALWTVGIAVGILMQHLGVTQDDAEQALEQLAAECGLSLEETAHTLVVSGPLTG